MSLFSRIFLWISKDPMQRSLYILVPTLHVALFGIFSLSASPEKQIQKKIVVKTFTQPAPAVKTQIVSNKKAAPISAPPKKAAPKVENKPTPPTPKNTPPIPIKKPPVPKKEKTIQVKKEKSAKDELLKELEERIAKIEVKNDRMAYKSELAIPSTLALSSEASLQHPKELQTQDTPSNEDFTPSLIGYLQSYLHLPEIGEVQIHLILNNDGKVKTMKVTKAESERNRKYLEEELPKISFPQIYLTNSSNSFLLTFCNKF